MWVRWLDGILSRFVRHGTLHLTYPDGAECHYGAGRPAVSVRLRDPDLPRRLVLDPHLTLGEAWMDATLEIAGDDLHGLLELAFRNEQVGVPGRVARGRTLLRKGLRVAQQFNTSARARRNVAHHYDLSAELYDLFLDTDRQYSCAYFPQPDLSLDQAQTAKKALIARKLRLKAGMRVLDIGCGWGGMALTLARDHGAEVLGITLSQEQLKRARERAVEAGLADRVRFELMDYRQVEGRFDRIVSVGMFEHVGLPHFRTYFGTVKRLLAEDGLALIHTIGRAAPPTSSNPWVTKYIFPGGYIPALSEVMSAVEKEALWPCDIEVLRLHYAETLRHWHDRFMANAERARAIYDDRFVRMWRFYLVSSEQSFRHGRMCVFQLQLGRRVDAAPITRDYLLPPAPQWTDPSQQAAE
jgi:cyclopropane-fatty-acyl-phospholipid synthase